MPRAPEAAPPTTRHKAWWPFRRRQRDERGVAMIMAVASLAIMAYFAMEVMYDSNVEYTVNAQGLNRLKAYYAAKAGVDLSLLRIKIYQQVLAKAGKNLGPYQNYVDEIWRFPFVWPLPMPPELNSVDQESLQKLMKESTLDASFATTINDEGSKLDLNDLISKSKVLRESASNRLIEIFRRKVESDDEWRRKYGSFRFDELVGNITDWMSDKSAGVNGGSKQSGYEELNKDGEEFPPNRGFRTLKELHLVKDMNDDFFDLLEPQVTIYGMKGVNPNVATKEVLMSLDEGIDENIADDIIKRRQDTKEGGPFTSAEQFWEFVNTSGARLKVQDVKTIPITTESLVSFRIKSTGDYGSAMREIEVIVTDLDRTAGEIKKYVDAEKPVDPSQPKPKEEEPKATAPKPLPKGPPRIVYWTER